jgi:hypothetical protein
MTKKFAMAGVALTALLALGVQAQVLGTISVSPQNAKVGEPVKVTATIDVLNSNYCGFVVSYGDGTSLDGVSDAQTAGPFVSTHTYTKAGTYSVTLGGRNVQSHPNCGGGEKAAPLTVVQSSNAAAGQGAAVAAAQAPAHAGGCPANWKLVPKSSNKKTGAFTCTAKPGTVLPATNPTCPGDLTYFENAKKRVLGCRP